MQFNTTTDYAVRILLYLATVERMAASKEIAEAMNIPPKYITTIVSRLKERKFIQTFQGAGGGYSLIRSPQEITLWDIVDTMEGGITINCCSVCDTACILFDGSRCALHRTYGAVQQSVESVLNGITLQSLIHDG